MGLPWTQSPPLLGFSGAPVSQAMPRQLTPWLRHAAGKDKPIQAAGEAVLFVGLGRLSIFICK